MTELSLGIITRLGEEPRERLQAIKELGLSHIQWQYGGNPESVERVDDIQAATRQFDLPITTIFCNFWGQSYVDIATVRAAVGLVPLDTQKERLLHVDTISQSAARIGVPRVALHIGFIPEDPDAPNYAPLVETTAQLADLLASRGQVLAFETGQETAATLKRFLEDVGRPNLRVNFDPANMILYGFDNPIEATSILAPWIDEVHCKDGRWPTQSGHLGHEAPLGEGDVNVEKWLETLLATGFRGPLTIEREISGPQQIEDVRKAVALLKSLLAKNEATTLAL